MLNVPQHGDDTTTPAIALALHFHNRRRKIVHRAVTSAAAKSNTSELFLHAKAALWLYYKLNNEEKQ